jgi:hypothetical protein
MRTAPRLRAKDSATDPASPKSRVARRGSKKNDDLYRFVSSSTRSGGAALTVARPANRLHLSGNGFFTKGDIMKRIAAVTAAAAVLAGAAAFAPAASANNVAWSVTVGAPGVAVSAGYPGYWGGYRYGYGYGHGYYRHWHRPVVVAPPVVYPVPVYVAPRPVVVAPPPVYTQPAPTYGYGYGYGY